TYRGAAPTHCNWYKTRPAPSAQRGRALARPRHTTLVLPGSPVRTRLRPARFPGGSGCPVATLHAHAVAGRGVDAHRTSPSRGPASPRGPTIPGDRDHGGRRHCRGHGQRAPRVRVPGVPRRSPVDPVTRVDRSALEDDEHVAAIAAV